MSAVCLAVWKVYSFIKGSLLFLYCMNSVIR